MFIILCDESLILKKEISTVFSYKGIHIFKMDEDFCFKFDCPYYINESYRIEERKYIIRNDEGLSEISIYVYRESTGLNDFGIYRKKDFYLSSATGADISTEDEYLKAGYLKYTDDYIETDYPDVFLNDKRYSGNKVKCGDKLCVLGLTIYIYADFLYINHFNNQINIEKALISGKDYVFKETKPKILNHYKGAKKEIKITEPGPFKRPNKPNDRKIIYQIGPSITMSLAMAFVASINIYTSYNNNGFTLSLIALAIMPLTIMFSGIVWPLLSRASENRKYKKKYAAEKKKYLDYLDTYEKKTLEDISQYKTNEDYYRFKENDVLEKLFYIGKDSEMFKTLNIGSYTKSFDFSYELSEDKDIDDKLISLKNRIADIGNIPLFINLKEHKRVSVITGDSKKIIRKFILELSYKYSADDLKIAVYFNDQELYEEIYRLPHLYYEKSRLVIKNITDLNLIATINDETVLLSDKDVDLDKENLAVIKLCSNRNEILKASAAVIEDNGIASVYETDKNRIFFSIDKPDLDYEKYFTYVSKVEVKDFFDRPISFSDASLSLDITKNYLNHDRGLSASFAYEDESVMSFDLHESKDGPHGLVGGSTGSGKSELLISLLLSLAIKYPPDYLNIILIDYKGGGIKESLTYASRSLPHIIASVDNLGEDSILRLMVAIDHELKKRERLFKELSGKSHTSIMSIDDYLNSFKDYKMPGMAHLLILVDEFAELKKGNPELIRELVSFSRIGRSLGLHLILATQKPNGVIDDEIWSNSHFKIALKVHDEKDSKEIIRSDKAASLKMPGEFYLYEDNSLRKGRAIYAKKDMGNTSRYEIGILNERLDYTFKKVIRNKKAEYESLYLSKKIIEASDSLQICPEMLDFKKPPCRDIEELLNDKKDELIFGETDDYLNARKEILSIKNDENIFVFTTRPSEINSVIFQLNRSEKRMIIISDKKYSLKYANDVISYDDEEELDYLFHSLFKETEERFTLLIENLNILLSYGEKYQDILVRLIKRSSLTKFNLIVFSDNSIVGYKLLNGFKEKLVVGMNDYQDLVNIFGVKGKYLGSSFFFDEIPIPFVETKIKSLQTEEEKIEPYLVKIPPVIPPEKGDKGILIGYLKKKRQKYYLSKDKKLLITSFNSDLLKKYRRIFNFLNIAVERYDNHLCMNNYELVLWVGDGIYSQRLFYPEKNIELKEDEGYFSFNGQGEIIALVNHESDNNPFLHHV